MKSVTSPFNRMCSSCICGKDVLATASRAQKLFFNLFECLSPGFLHQELDENCTQDTDARIDPESTCRAQALVDAREGQCQDEIRDPQGQYRDRSRLSPDPVREQFRDQHPGDRSDGGSKEGNGQENGNQYMNARCTGMKKGSHQDEGNPECTKTGKKEEFPAQLIHRSHGNQGEDKIPLQYFARNQDSHERHYWIFTLVGR